MYHIKSHLTKSRKYITTIDGFSDDNIVIAVKQFRDMLHCNGSIINNNTTIQLAGDHVDNIVEILRINGIDNVSCS